MDNISESDLLLLALRASCADVCSYAVQGTPASCYGQCRRKLSDFDPGEVSNMQAVVSAVRKRLETENERLRNRLNAIESAIRSADPDNNIGSIKVTLEEGRRYLVHAVDPEFQP